MRRLLIDCPRTGYPAEYLVARIQSRKKAFWPEQKKGAAGGASPGDGSSVQRKSQDERTWLYMQMNVRLREWLGPLIFFFELDNLAVCLRILESRNSQAELEERLERSLLGKALQRIILAGTTLADSIAGLEAFLKDTAFRAGGLRMAYQEKGVQGTEELLRRRFLEDAPGICRHPEVRRFMCRLIDRQNIMTMAKCLHWRPESKPPLIRGGSLRLRKGDRDPDGERLKTLLSRFVGGFVAAEDDLLPIRLRDILDNHHTLLATRWMRDADSIRCCTGYLWYCAQVEQERGREKYVAGFSRRFSGEEERAE